MFFSHMQVEILTQEVWKQTGGVTWSELGNQQERWDDAERVTGERAIWLKSRIHMYENMDTHVWKHGYTCMKRRIHMYEKTMSGTLMYENTTSGIFMYENTTSRTLMHENTTSRTLMYESTTSGILMYPQRSLLFCIMIHADRKREGKMAIWKFKKICSYKKAFNYSGLGITKCK